MFTQMAGMFRKLVKLKTQFPGKTLEPKENPVMN